MNIVDLISLFLFGIGIGAFGTLVGAGGGFLAVPFLLLVYHFDTRQAAGTSLFFVFFNALSGTIAYLKMNRVDLRAGILFSLAGVPGSILGAFVTSYLESTTFSLIFAGMLIVVAVNLLFGPPKTSKKTDGEARHRVNYKLGIVLSFAVGFTSSILGIGGGIINVPMMILVLGFPVSVATATSEFILTITSLFGVATHSALGNVSFYVGGAMGLGGLLGAQLGALLSKRVTGALIKKFLAIALLVTGIRLVIQALFGF